MVSPPIVRVARRISGLPETKHAAFHGCNMSRSPRLGYILFILLNAVLFIRPSELLPLLLEIPLYEGLILSCLLVSAFAVLNQLTPSSLAQNPVDACAVCLLGSVIASHLCHFQIGEAIESATEFIKTLLYYFLLVALLDSVARLRGFLFCLLFFILVLTSLALVHYHGIVSIPVLEAYHERQWELMDEESGEDIVLARLQSIGIYGNPNDLARILVVGILLSVYFMGDNRLGMFRLLWLLPMALLGHALHLTFSRGGLLSLFGGLISLFLNRYGRRKTILASALILPVLLIAFGGRQTSMSTSEGTGQKRIKIWNEGFVALQSSPLFGIGMNHYQEEIGMVAHNSFVHCYVELGFVGGTLFFAMFYLPIRTLRSRSLNEPGSLGADVTRLRPLIPALLIATAVGMLSSSRSYTAPSYLIFGLSAAYLKIASDRGQALLPRFNSKLVGQLSYASALTLCMLYIYVRLAGHY